MLIVSNYTKLVTFITKTRLYIYFFVFTTAKNCIFTAFKNLSIPRSKKKKMFMEELDERALNKHLTKLPPGEKGKLPVYRR